MRPSTLFLFVALAGCATRPSVEFRYLSDGPQKTTIELRKEPTFLWFGGEHLSIAAGERAKVELRPGTYAIGSEGRVASLTIERVDQGFVASTTAPDAQRLESRWSNGEKLVVYLGGLYRCQHIDPTHTASTEAEMREGSETRGCVWGPGVSLRVDHDK